MGEKQNQPFQLSFNASLKVDFQGSRVTSDGGLILVRELDERLGFGELINQHLSDARRGKNNVRQLIRISSTPSSGMHEGGVRVARISGMMSGNFRSESHVERNWIAKDHQLKWPPAKASPAKKLPNR